jgi:pyruvate kinase
MNKELLCTLGPASMNDRIITRLEEVGASLFRLNLSHTPLFEVANAIEFIQKRSSVPICLDTEGAQIRTGHISNAPVTLHDGCFVNISGDTVKGTAEEFNLTPENIVRELQVDDFISIDFNAVLGQVVDVRDDGATLRVINGGDVGMNKAVTVQRDIAMPPLSLKDIEAVAIGCKLGIRHFALSFAGQARDVKLLRGLASKDAVIISKIESRRGLANLEDITNASDAILIDRGDLSREIPIVRIPAAQKHIAAEVKKIGKKLYVATNLLESMITAPTPTRAEVNDIYNTLADGADGLVLAAETAIGKYPLLCANMIVSLVNEFNRDNSKDSESYDSLPPESQLVAPHGGTLVNREASSEDLENLEGLQVITIDDDTLSDCQLIAAGTYSPLTGFMDQDSLASVLDNNVLPNGMAWTLPIVLPLPKHIAENISVGERIKLASKSGLIHAVLDASEIYPANIDDLAQKWFGTASNKHPGINRLKKLGDYFVAGSIILISKIPYSFARYELTPQQCRFVFTHKGWRHVVGFHTRNIAHRAHEYIQLQALERTHADGLFINPVLGGKKEGDFLSEPIMKSYQLLLEGGVYPEGGAVLGGFSTYSRYSGPREAVFTALCRKNMGCSFFIIGRDHTGVGDFYGPDENRRLFDEVGDIGVMPVYFDAIGYDSNKNEYCSLGNAQNVESISATRFRKALAKRESVPEWFIRQPIQDMLLAEILAGREIFHQ